MECGRRTPCVAPRMSNRPDEFAAFCDFARDRRSRPHVIFSAPNEILTTAATGTIGRDVSPHEGCVRRGQSLRSRDNSREKSRWPEQRRAGAAAELPVLRLRVPTLPTPPNVCGAGATGLQACAGHIRRRAGYGEPEASSTKARGVSRRENAWKCAAGASSRLTPRASRRGGSGLPLPLSRRARNEASGTLAPRHPGCS
jgi:hypothetical protein